MNPSFSLPKPRPVARWSWAGLFVVLALSLPATAVRAQEAPAPAAVPAAAELDYPLEDEGGAYMLEKVPKIEGRYRFLNEEQTLVRLPHLPRVPVHSHDDDFLYIKLYKPKPHPAAREATIAENWRGEVAPAMAKGDTLTFTKLAGLPEGGQWRNGFDLADINADGHLDMVHAPPRKSFVAPPMFLGDGKGGFTRWSPKMPAFEWDYGDVEVTDLDEDGLPDLVLAIHLRGLVSFRQVKKGEFEIWGEGLPMAPTRGRVTGAYSSRAIAAVDWNRDGLTDIVALSEGAGSPQAFMDGVDTLRGKRLFLNDGKGNWTTAPLDQNDLAIGDKVLVADLDGDGHPELVTDTKSLSDRGLVHFHADEVGFETIDLELRRREIVRSVATGDLDGDNDIDILLTFRLMVGGVEYSGIDAYWNDGTGRSYQRQLLYEESRGSGWTSLGIGDLNGDGVVDFVAAGREGSLMAFLGIGDGRFRIEDSPELAAGPQHVWCGGYQTTLADLDGDGRDEVLQTLAGESGSEKLLGFTPRCPGQGGVFVWSPAPSAAAATASAGP